MRGEQVYGPVVSGESLWTIAKQLANGGNVQRMMNELHALNPSAFVNGDMNRLRVGVTLATPTSVAPHTSSTAKTPDAESTTSVTAADTIPSTGDAARELDRLLDASTSTGDEVTTAAVVEVATSVSETSAVDDALTAKLAALDAKFAAIRAKYEASATSSSGVASAPGVNAPPVDIAPPAAGPAAGAVADAIEPKPVARPPAPFVSVPVESAVPSSDRLLGFAAYAVLGLAGLTFVAWALKRNGGFRLARSLRAAADTGRAADADRKAEVARKAENRVRMESEIKGLLDRKGRTLRPVEPAPPIDLADTADPSSVSALEQTMDVLPGSVPAMLEQDREVAIDASIAHGRYAEAEALLREVCKSHPRNVQAKLRLAEVYYITEQIEGFGEVATDIKDHHRADLTDDEWQRVVRMGKIIAPDLVLFSGPKAVGRRA